MSRQKPPKPAPKPLYGLNRLRYWREKREMTLEEAGEVVGMSHAQLGRIERRLQPYNQDLLEKLAKLYETRVSSLIETGLEEELGPRWEEAKKYLEFLKSRE